MQTLNTLKRYWRIYKQLLNITLKRMLEYRLNFALRSIHPLFYAGMFFSVILVIFSKTTLLVGWNRDEVLLMFSVLHCMYGVQMFIFMMGIEQLMSNRIRRGELDFDLLKPVNTQFLATLQNPWIDAVIFFIFAFILFVRQVVVLQSQITLLNFVLFSVVFLTSLFIWYLITSTIATISFFVTQAAQVVYFLEKISDYAPYPTTVFPKGIQFVAWTIFPIAFYSFIPTSILVGRATPEMWTGILIMLPTAFLLNMFAWKYALKHYSSASS